MEQSYDSSPLIGPDPQDRERIHRPMVYGVLGGAIALAVGTLFIGIVHWITPPEPPGVQASETPAMTTPPAPLEPFIKVPTTFAHLDRRPPAPPLPPVQPMFAPPPLAQTTPPPPPAAPPVVKETTPAPALPAQQERRGTKAPAPKPAPPERTEDNDWLFADIKAAPKKAHGQGGGPGGLGERRRTSQLFPAAQWERPADPTKVLYASQIIHVIAEQAISSEESATVRLRVTETVYDRFGQLNVLIPQYSTILATAEGGNVQRGQARIPLKISKVELPDGTDLTLTGKGGSTDGASGVPGKVDNKYGTVIAATLLSTVFSIAPRVAAGSPSNFQPNLAQEFAGNAATQMSQDGRELVRRSLDVQPVITVEALQPLILSLDHNISLQSKPLVVYK